MKNTIRISVVFTAIIMIFPYFAPSVAAEVTITTPLVHFPQDELPHPETDVEWWYYSGHLEDEQGRGYGVMASFFIARFGNMPDNHFMIYALTEKDDGVFHSGSIIQKSMIDMMKMVADNPPPGLADMVEPEFFELDTVEQHHHIMQGEPVVMKDQLAIKYEDNYFRRIAGEGRDFKSWKYRTKIVGEDFGYTVEMSPQRVPMLVDGDGEVGMSEDEAMFYYSFPRMKAQGVVQVGGEERKVTGTMWYDHQFGSMGGPEDPVGWDWFCLQLENGMDLNLSALRKLRNGERFNRLATVQRNDGRVSVVKDLIIEPLGRWKSPETGITYPLGWKLALPSLEAEFTVMPVFEEQEMRTFGPFRAIWEGACTVEATVAGEKVEGDGYTELVGYAYKQVE